MMLRRFKTCLGNELGDLSYNKTNSDLLDVERRGKQRAGAQYGLKLLVTSTILAIIMRK